MENEKLKIKNKKMENRKDYIYLYNKELKTKFESGTIENDSRPAS